MLKMLCNNIVFIRINNTIQVFVMRQQIIDNNSKRAIRAERLSTLNQWQLRILAYELQGGFIHVVVEI